MMFLVLLFLAHNFVLSNGSTEREMTVELPAGREECFFEAVAAGQILDVDYQVVDGGRQNDFEVYNIDVIFSK